MNTDSIPEVIAAEIALAFQGSREKVVNERILDESGLPTSRFPRFEEHVIPKTTAEIADTETTITFVSPNGLLYERPLTFLEIVEKMYQLGYLTNRNENL